MRAVGIDISHWQGSFTPQGNIDFVIQKVSEGLSRDPLFDELLIPVKTIEHRGAYHYFRTEIDPVEQAEFFYMMQGNQGFKFLAMDYERHGNTLNATGEANLWKFYQKLKSLTSKPIYLYTTEYTLRDNLLIHNDRWLDIPFWVARYNAGLDEQKVSPLFLDIRSDWEFWQYSNIGNGGEYGVDSTNVDLNVWNGPIQIEGSSEMKKWYNSKTLRFTLLFALVQVAGLFGYADFSPGTDVTEYINLGVALVATILRVITSQGIEP